MGYNWDTIELHVFYEILNSSECRIEITFAFLCFLSANGDSLSVITHFLPHLRHVPINYHGIIRKVQCFQCTSHLDYSIQTPVSWEAVMLHAKHPQASVLISPTR